MNITQHLLPVAILAATLAGASIASAGELSLFADQSKWEFKKNTGEGRFEISAEADGKKTGILHYDFTQVLGDKPPYVIARTPIDIKDGATQFNLSVRSSVAQPLSFRFKDSTGQTHQAKVRVKGTGTWETIQIPFTKKMEHWGGAKDGVVHFPVVSLAISVPRPSETEKSGKIEFADAVTN